MRSVVIHSVASESPAMAPSARKPLRCVIVEDHQMFTELLSTMLAAAPGLSIDVVGSASTVAEGIAACDRLRPDVVLLDLALPDGTGIGVAEHVAATLPKARVVVVSGQSSTFVCPKALAACTHAVVHKSEAFDVLQSILVEISQRGSKAPVAVGPRGRPKLDTLLSQREREILALVGRGQHTEEIAAALGISKHTVHTHRKNIAAKLGVEGKNLPLAAYRFRDQLGGAE